MNRNRDKAGDGAETGAADSPADGSRSSGATGRSGRLIQGRDYHLDEKGRFVLSADYLARRGYCCGNGCRHCPY